MDKNLKKHSLSAYVIYVIYHKLNKVDSHSMRPVKYIHTHSNFHITKLLRQYCGYSSNNEQLMIVSANDSSDQIRARPAK